MAKKITKAEAMRQFGELWAMCTKSDPKWKRDTIAKRESWNNFTDCLQRDGLITSHQCDNWTNPY